MTETQRKLHEAMLLLKSAATDIEKDTSRLDPLHEEISTSFALAARAHRMLVERESEVS